MGDAGSPAPTIWCLIRLLSTPSEQSVAKVPHDSSGGSAAIRGGVYRIERLSFCDRFLPAVGNPAHHRCRRIYTPRTLLSRRGTDKPICPCPFIFFLRKVLGMEAARSLAASIARGAIEQDGVRTPRAATQDRQRRLHRRGSGPQANRGCPNRPRGARGQRHRPRHRH